jgi:hypothetical protein
LPQLRTRSGSVTGDVDAAILTLGGNCFSLGGRDSTSASRNIGKKSLLRVHWLTDSSAQVWGEEPLLSLAKKEADPCLPQPFGCTPSTRQNRSRECRLLDTDPALAAEAATQHESAADGATAPGHELDDWLLAEMEEQHGGQPSDAGGPV